MTLRRLALAQSINRKCTPERSRSWCSAIYSLTHRKKLVMGCVAVALNAMTSAIATLKYFLICTLSLATAHVHSQMCTLSDKRRQWRWRLAQVMTTSVCRSSISCTKAAGRRDAVYLLMVCKFTRPRNVCQCIVCIVFLSVPLPPYRRCMMIINNNHIDLHQFNRRTRIRCFSACRLLAAGPASLVFYAK